MSRDIVDEQFGAAVSVEQFREIQSALLSDGYSLVSCAPDTYACPTCGAQHAVLLDYRKTIDQFASWQLCLCCLNAAPIVFVFDDERPVAPAQLATLPTPAAPGAAV